MDIEKVPHIQWTQLLKKEGNNAICTYIDGHRDYHIKSNRERQISYHLYEVLKNDTK